jgi:hypothetical protein
MKSAFPLALTDRDLAMLDMVFSYSGLGVHHLRQRFFHTAGARAACYARTAKLIAAGYLTGHRLPAWTGQGSGKRFLTLGPAARPILAKVHHCSVAALQRQTRAKAPALLNHELAIVDFRLGLELAVQASPFITELAWTSEWDLRRRPVRVTDPVTGMVVPLIADGAFTLTLTDRSRQDFLVEVDMATLAAKRLRVKLRGYLVWARQHSVAVLWVTAGAERAMAIAKLAVEEATRLNADPTIFWVTLQSSISERGMLSEPIWQVAGGPTALALASLAAGSSRTKGESDAVSLEPIGGP